MSREFREETQAGEFYLQVVGLACNEVIWRVSVDRAEEV